MTRSGMPLDEVVDLIDADPAYANGTREAPRRIVRSEALVVVDDLFAGCNEADQTIPAAAEGVGSTIACGAGCDACCEPLVLITLTEAMAIVRKLDSEGMVSRRDYFLERLEEWEVELGERALRAARAFNEGRNREYLRLAHEHALAHVVCPFDVDGLCQVYDARPLKCRQAWVVDTSEYCAASEDPEQPNARVVTHQAFEDFHERAQRMMRGVQSALGHGVAKRPIANAVLEVLAQLEKD